MSARTRAMSVVFSICCLTVAASALALPRDMRRPKKLIANGWDGADTKRLRENLREMERRPFDGVVVDAVGRTGEDKPCRLCWAFCNEKWQREWFQPCIDDLKACKFERFTDNFLQFLANPGSVDWHDDDGWRNIVDHWRIAAWIAKQSGMKGIAFDAEPYNEPYSQFHYAAQPERDRHTFEEYCDKARQRGREVIEAVAREYPDITLLTYFMNSVEATATGHENPRRVLAGDGYGLYPAFIDGWLDAVPPAATLVDGCESAYRYNSEQEYLEAGTLIKGNCQELVSPENRAKYRAQVQVSFGIYLDAYWNPKDSEWGTWYVDGKGGPRVKRLEANVRTALRVADEYVWVYGEKFRWWPTPNESVRQQTWPEALPGSEDSLFFARDPVAYGRAKIAKLQKAGKLDNLARNGDFHADRADDKGRVDEYREGGTPAGWGSWQREDSHGTFAWDRQSGDGDTGSARASGVADGCFLQSHPVAPGERYVVQAVRRLSGRGTASIRVRWQTPKEEWTSEERDRLLFAGGPPERWSELFGVVDVPEGVGRLVILLGVSGQQSEKDLAWYDNVRLYRLP